MRRISPPLVGPVFGLVLGALLAVTLPTEARATIVKAFSLDGMTAAADAVVHGEVVGSEVVYDARWRRVYTESWVEVSSSAWGTARPGDIIVVRQIGGELDGVVSHVEGTVRLAVGDEVVVFARTDGQFHYLVGMAQGAYHVDRSAAGPPRVHRGVGGLRLVTPLGPARPAAAHRMTLTGLMSRVTRALTAVGRLP